MRAAGHTAPRFGPKQTKSLHDRDIGIGGGPKSGSGMGSNRRNDTGLLGREAATEGRGARAGNVDNERSAEGRAHQRIVNETTDTATAGNVKGQKADGPGKGGIGAYRPKHEDGGAGMAEERIKGASDAVHNDGYSTRNRHGGHNGHMRLLGKHGHHHSTEKYEHSGYEHSSEDR